MASASKFKFQTCEQLISAHELHFLTAKMFLGSGINRNGMCNLKLAAELLQNCNTLKMRVQGFLCFILSILLSVPVEMIEDGPSGAEVIDGQLLAPPSSSAHVNQEKEPFKKLGLTKEVLAVHTQKEEQSFLNKFKEIKRFNIFQSHCNYYLQDKPKGRPAERGMAIVFTIKLVFISKVNPVGRAFPCLVVLWGQCEQ